jgi:hypothetical protein
VNPRRVVVEDRVLSLADALEGEAPLMAVRLREAVPRTYGLCDEHLPVLRAALADTATRWPATAEPAGRILAALDDLPAHIGRRGVVWIGRSMDDEGDESGYSAHWTDEDWLEGSPEHLDPDEVLSWARARTEDVRWGHDPDDPDALAVLLRRG